MEIILPKIKITEKAGSFGKFSIAPLQPGYGITIGNSLRRILLSSLAGSSVKTISIEGVDHEFSTLSGIKEDVIEIILAFKNLRIKYDNDDEEVELIIKEKGPKQVTAKDIQAPGNVEIVNPNLPIATLQKSGELFARLVVDRGIGYVSVEEREEENRAIGEIAIDSNYAPIDHVDYKVSQTRVGGTTDYDELVLGITTDGTVEPEAALKQAARILVEHFNLISQLDKAEKETVDIEIKEEKAKIIKAKPVKGAKKTATKKAKITRQTSVKEAGLSSRTVNVLQSNNIRTIGGLARFNAGTLQEMEGLGSKSVSEVTKKLKQWKIK